ncbi:MAG: hypothetical protein F6K11_33305 [Leptolyngbya sp. SIO3F4]|nr:hypothetical protein [Leptolyngbya sp. SIO3F4]
MRTAVINERAGSCGLILGCKTFQREFKEGIKLFQLIQDVHSVNEVTIAQYTDFSLTLNHWKFTFKSTLFRESS